MSLLTSLTIFLLLGQNSHLFTFWKIQEEKHSLLSDYVRKIHIIYLEFRDAEVTGSCFPKKYKTIVWDF